MAPARANPEPLVSVILPVFNGQPFVAAAVISIVKQTYRNIELIIIDDGSTDGSSDVLHNFADADPRVRLVTHENRGLVASLNEGLELAKGKYIARMDADDISDPIRIERQVEYLETNPEVVLLGVRTFERRSSRWRHHISAGPKLWTWMLLFTNRIGHPGVMIRRETLDQHNLRYEQDFYFVEDYRLWCRLVQYGSADVLPQPLLFYRRHDSALSVVNASLQSERDRRVTRDFVLGRLGIDLTDVLNADKQAWLAALRQRIFTSARFESLPSADRSAIHRAYQEFSVSAGFPAFINYVRLVGPKAVMRRKLFGAGYLCRLLKNAIKPELYRKSRSVHV